MITGLREKDLERGSLLASGSVLEMHLTHTNEPVKAIILVTVKPQALNRILA